MPTVILVGNPNVGKSVLFQQLTGKYVTVSNYPGTTVEITQGIGKFSGKKYRVIDTPGTNSLIPKSEDERVTLEVLLTETGSGIVQIADSKNLIRALPLTLQLLELDRPVILVLNMADEAKERGIHIDISKLSAILHIPIIQTVAVTGKGINELKSKLVTYPSVGSRYTMDYGKTIESALSQIQQILPAEYRGKRNLGLLRLNGIESNIAETVVNVISAKSRKEINESRTIKEIITETQTQFSKPLSLVIAEKQLRAAQDIASQVTQIAVNLQVSLSEKISRITLQPISGGIIVLLVLYLMYEFVGRFAAGWGVDFLSKIIFGHYLNPFITRIVLKIIPWEFVQQVLVGQYGLVTMALTYAFAIIFPIVTAFFIFFGLLEDSGYLPRLAALSDRIFNHLGLHGKAVLPMVLGLGCGTMAVLTSRILDTKKERFIAILLLGLAIPCSAQLGVILAMLAAFSWKAMIIWLSSILISLFFVGYLAAKLVPGERSRFLLELPPIRVPQLKNILLKTGARIQWYLKEAVPLFILGTLILFFFDKFHILAAIEKIAAPVVQGFLGLPKAVTESFLIGFLRRDYGAAGLLVLEQHGLLSLPQVIVSAVAITLFIPCIAQFMITIKEQGVKLGMLIFGAVISYALLFSGMLNLILKVFNV
ncbi:MAG: ferrous iron transport protein B [bacterium]